MAAFYKLRVDKETAAKPWRPLAYRGTEVISEAATTWFIARWRGEIDGRGNIRARGE